MELCDVIFDKKYFTQLFTNYSELLSFLTEGVDATQDYKIEEMADWMKEMYVVAEEIKEEFLKNLDAESPLYFLIQKASTKRRSIELERTCLCLMTMEAISTDNYNFFETTPVLSGKTITKEQFKYAKDLIEKYFPKDSRKLLQLELILGDFGKIRPLREKLCSSFNISAHDPDLFMTALFEQGYEKMKAIFPCVSTISEKEFDELLKINTGFHYGHFAHTESTEREIERLRIVLEDRGISYLYKNILVQIFDVAGAAAQSKGKLLLNEAICNTYLNDMLSVLENLDSSKSIEVYQEYLVKRLKVCQLIDEESKIETLDNKQYLLGRLLCMFRIYDNSSAKKLENALNRLFLNQEFKKNIEILNKYQTDNRFFTPTYMPAFLNALKDSNRLMELAESEQKDNQIVALCVGMNIIAKVLEAHQSLIEKNELKVINPINFNPLTGIVKSDFDQIIMLYKSPQISIGKTDGLAYPTVWLEKNKPDETKNYVHTDKKKESNFDGENNFFLKEENVKDTQNLPNNTIATLNKGNNNE